MLIEALVNKAKPPGYINLGVAIDLIAKAISQQQEPAFERKAYAILRKELRGKRVKIKVRSKDDKTNEYYRYNALGSAVWENERKSIFSTGRISYRNMPAIA